MFKRILIYTTAALVIFFWVNQQKFSAPYVFNDWQVVKLVWAAKKGDTQKMDQLIQRGADVNYNGKFSFTPLTWILTMVKPSPKTKAGFRHLLLNGASTSVLLPMSSQTALHFAAGFDDNDFLKLIIEHGQNVKINDHRFGKTPLEETLAIGDSKYENFLILLNNGADLKIKRLESDSLLFRSSVNGTWRYALELLKRGANYHEKPEYITLGNPEDLPHIVWALENLKYWPIAALRGNGVDYREKVVEFLRAEGVQVYPWYPEEDPRHNPSPKAILNEEEIKEMWDYCYQLKRIKTETFTLQRFNDVNLYSDISPDNYSFESNSVFGLAMINLRKYHKGINTKIISAEFYGRDQDKYSDYFFKDGNLQCFLTVQDLYDRFKTQEGSQIERTIVEAYLTYKDTCYKRDTSSQFERLKSEACKTIRTDAATYKAFVEKN